MARKGGNPETYFKSNYSGKVAKKAVGVKLPLELDAYVRSRLVPFGLVARSCDRKISTRTVM